MILSWEKNFDECSEIIRANKNKFKIILKTKDEAEMLSDWLEWHLSIVSENQIFIFDNVSTNQRTFEIYRKYKNLNVISFSGFHNDLHRPSRVRGLYEAINESTEYYIFLDTDERLACLQKDCPSLLPRNMIEELILRVGMYTIPTIWIDNVPGKNDVFVFDKNQDHFKTGINGGKPIINCKRPVFEMMNHNFQLKGEIFDSIGDYIFLVFHLKNYDAMQRINANIKKLVAYNAFKIMPSNFIPTLDNILKIDYSIFPEGNKRKWMQEIHKMSHSINHQNILNLDNELSKWQFKTSAKDELIFGSFELKDYFRNSFVNNINV